MGQTQWTEVSSKCVASTGCCQQHYADAGTIKLESVPVPETPVNWDNLQKAHGGRRSREHASLLISSDAPEQIHREFESGVPVKRSRDRKGTGFAFVYKNAAEVSDDDCSDGTGVQPLCGDTVSEQQNQFDELADPSEDEIPQGKKRLSVADELEAGMYDNMNFCGQAVEVPTKISGAPKVETKVLCVLLNKERGKLGFQTDLDNEGVLVIGKIEKGVLDDWNSDRSESDRVAVGDTIASINNTRGDPKHLEDMITKYVSLKLEIKAHEEFEVRIEKTKEAKLGLDVKARKNNMTLPIIKIHQGGLVAQWNAEKHNATKQVREGDRVLALNGESGESEFLKKQLSTQSGSLVLTIARIVGQ